MENFEYINDLMNMPVIPLRGLVVFPEMVLHFDVGRKKSIAALKHAMNSNQKVFWLLSVMQLLMIPILMIYILLVLFVP